MSIGLFLGIVIACFKVGACFCPNGWVRYEDSCYSFIKTNQTWSSASNSCKSLGSNLATVESAHENTFLKGFLKDVTCSKKAWLGGTDIVTEGLWEWVTGGKFYYTDWALHEPDTRGGKNEDCAFMSHYSWGDETCDDAMSFICEKVSPKDDLTILG